MTRLSSERHVHRSSTAVLLALLMLPVGEAMAYPFGSATCDAYASGGFMIANANPRTHHPGQNGGFGLIFTTPDYYPGEALGVTLRHGGSEVFTGFLIYPETADGFRRGLFTPIAGSTLSGGLPGGSGGCANLGHTITHDNYTIPSPLRTSLSLAWKAPDSSENLAFRALVLRADPMRSPHGTDFYEVSAALPASVDGIFRSKFESIP